MKEYKVHLVAPEEYKILAQELSVIENYQKEKINLKVTGWDYSFSSLNYWVDTDDAIIPDVFLIFDVADYSKHDLTTGKNVGYKNLIDSLKKTKLRMYQSKFVIILSKEKENNLMFLNELIKLDIQNFYFASDFTIDNVKEWLFSPDRSLKDNEKYIITEVIPMPPEQAQVEEKKKKSPFSININLGKKEVVEKVVEKTEVEVIEKVVNTSMGPTIIAIGGTKEGAGTTNMAINIAKYLKTIHRKVALIEMNSRPVLKGIGIPGIDIYSQNYIGYVMDKPVNLMNVINSDNYGYIVLDLGALYKLKNENDCTYNERTAENAEYFHEMNRSHISILVHPGGEWNLKYLTPFLINNDINSRWKLALMHTDIVDKRIKEEFKNYYAAPYILDVNTEETISFMQDMLKEVMTVRKQKKGLSNKLSFIKNLKKRRD